MKSIKMCLSIIVVICIALSTLPTMAQASMETYTDGYVTYRIEEDGAWVYQCDKAANGTVFIKRTINGYPVVAIWPNAFVNCSEITKVNIPDGVHTIGGYAFSGCTGLKSVVIPSSVTSIQASAFEECHSLESIEIPNSVTEIGKNAFNGCYSLTSIDIPGSIAVVEDMTFAYCSYLSHVWLQEGVEQIGSNAFWYCGKLGGFTIPSALKQIDNMAFQECVSLTEIYLSDIAAWCSVVKDSHPFSFSEHMSLHFYYLNGRKIEGDLVIPDGTEFIGGRSFWRGCGITSVMIPESVTGIGFEAFRECIDITSFTFCGDVPTIASDAFEGVVAYAYYPENNATWTADVMQDYGGDITWVALSTEEAKKYAVQYHANGGVGAPAAQTKKENENVVLSSEVPARDGYTFLGWSTLSNGSVEYHPGDVYSLNSDIVLYAVWQANTYSVTYDANGGTDAPEDQTKEHNVGVIISNQEPHRDGHLFLGWSITPNGEVAYRPGDVYSLNIDAVLYAVWQANTYSVIYAANGGTNAPEEQVKVYGKDLVISGQIPLRENYQFVGWSTAVNGSVEYVAGDIYTENESITLYAVWEHISEDTSQIIASGQCGDNVKWKLSENGTLTVYGAGRMTEWYSSTYTNAPWYPYRDKIQKVVIEDGVENVGGYAFYKYYSLVELEIGNSVTVIGQSAFSMSNLCELEIPYNVKRIGNNAFYYCDDLTAVVFSNSLKIESGAFGTCQSLEKVYVPGIAMWCQMEFDSYDSNPLFYGNLYVSNTLSTDVVIPYGVSAIPGFAFAGYKNLHTVSISDGVASIGNGAFWNCTGLTGIEIPQSVNNIGSSAFYKCANLKNVVILNGVTEIGANTFQYCTYLENISIPVSVTMIGDYAFDCCSCLCDVYYGGSAQQWSSIIIGGANTALTEAILHTKENTLVFAGAALALHHNLAINYKVDAALFGAGGYSDPYVVFEINGEKKIVDTYSIEGDRYVFSFCDIAPNQMNDTIHATLYGSFGGVEYSSDAKQYSVSTYCYNMLEKCRTDEYAEFRTLLVDLLHYGAASQIYTGYKTATLVDARLTDTQLAWGTSTDRTFETLLDPAYQQIETPIVSWKGAGLNLQDAVTMRLKFTAESIDGVVLIIKSDVGSWRITSEKFVQTDGGYYAFFNGLNAGQMSEPVYLTFYEGDRPVSNTARYSIESYAFSKQNSEEIRLVELLKAMMRYGDSAYAYVN